MTEEGTVFCDGHYEVILPLQNPTVPVPNNRDWHFGWEVQEEIQFRSFLQDGSMSTSLMTCLWRGMPVKCLMKTFPGTMAKCGIYLTFGMVPTQKDKLPVILDAASRFLDTQLNDLILSGCNLTNYLVGVLHQFSQDRVAFTSDLECLFYQVKVPVLRDFLRFLWWPGGDISKAVIECYIPSIFT